MICPTDHRRARGPGFSINRRTVTRHLTRLGLTSRRFIDPDGDNNRMPGKIKARWPGPMVHLDVKKVGQIPDGRGWRETRRHLPAFGHRRLLLHRAARRREGNDRRCVPHASQGVVRGPRHQPHPPHSCRQRCVYRSADFARIVGNRTRHQRTRLTPHDTMERWSATSGSWQRGAPSRSRVHQRRRTLDCGRGLEHPLQLPPSAQWRRRSATSIMFAGGSHQCPGLLLLVIDRGAVREVVDTEADAEYIARPRSSRPSGAGQRVVQPPFAKVVWPAQPVATASQRTC